MYERQKDSYKANYFWIDSLERKRKEILENPAAMGNHLIGFAEMESILKAAFQHVACYWFAGNFFGFIATDNKAAYDCFEAAMPIDVVPFSNLVWTAVL